MAWARLRRGLPSRVLARAPLACSADAPWRRALTSLASPRARALAEEEALRLLRGVLDPSLVRIRQLTVHPSGKLGVELEFSSAGCPKSKISAETSAIMRKLPWVNECELSTSIRRPSSFMGLKAPESLKHVGTLIGVSSCKGGVGKSTVAANLAFALAELGSRVGLLDADVHGPSLPSLVSLPADALPVTQKAENKLLRPPNVGGVKLMSFGYVAKGASRGETSAAVMRGPMTSKVVQQLLAGTEWGELDYLLVDLPPGTGDIQLTLCQTYSLTGALVVTTPQRLSRVDVLKGIDMWKELRVPVLGVIENMAYFKDGHGEVHYPFGRTQLEAIRQYSQVPAESAFQMPIEEDVTLACDEGIPVLLARPSSETSKVFRQLAERFVLEVAQLRDPQGAHNHLQIRFDPARGAVLRILQGPEEGSEFVLSSSDMAALEGGPGVASKLQPTSVDLVVARGAGNLDAGDSRAVVDIRWEGGGQSLIPAAELIRRARAQGIHKDV